MNDPIEVTIGTADTCNIRVVDQYASSVHAKLVIHLGLGRVTIEDCGSTNGTWLSKETQERVYAPTPVDMYDFVKIGRTRLSVRELILAASRMAG
jgi:pSer/pThr/pTyr-binding forkhead associated (FHA) protein